MTNEAVKGGTVSFISSPLSHSRSRIIVPSLDLFTLPLISPSLFNSNKSCPSLHAGVREHSQAFPLIALIGLISRVLQS